MEPSVSRTKRIGIMGGSFDPVHVGHLIMAQDAIDRLELSGVVFIPAAIPPHKQHLQQVNAEHRINMLRLATEADLRLSVSDIELKRGGVSYTIDTIRALQQEQPGVEWILTVGSDTLVDLHNWYKIDELLSLCEVATFLRPGESCLDEIAEKVLVADVHKEKLLSNVVEAHLIALSSTEIRMRIAEGLGIRYLVP
ncbi:MAG TPA: nicotinate-nucleotide adenylyltransferase, partial [Pontiella sp.]